MPSLTWQQVGLGEPLPDPINIAESDLTPVEAFSSRQQSGIYFLAMGGTIVYVGQSIDVHSRLSAHLANPPASFDRFGWTPCSAEGLNDLEAFYIARYRPVANKGLPPNSRYLTAKQARAVVRERTGTWLSPKFFSQTPSFSLPGHPQKAHLQYYDVNAILASMGVQ